LGQHFFQTLDCPIGLQLFRKASFPIRDFDVLEAQYRAGTGKL
jgi:hypothetical protein